METDEPTPVLQSQDPNTSTASQKEKKVAAAKMSFEDYKRMSNMLVLYMRQIEEQEEAPQQGKTNLGVDPLGEGRGQIGRI